MLINKMKIFFKPINVVGNNWLAKDTLRVPLFGTWQASKNEKNTIIFEKEKSTYTSKKFQCVVTTSMIHQLS